MNSGSVADDVRSVLGEARSLRRVHNAVDTSVFRPDGPALDLAAASGLAPDRGLVRIGLVATFARWKGHEVFLDAIARVARQHPVRGYIIGGPVYQTVGSQCSLEELKAYAALGWDWATRSVSPVTSPTSRPQCAHYTSSCTRARVPNPSEW